MYFFCSLVLCWGSQDVCVWIVVVVMYCCCWSWLARREVSCVLRVAKNVVVVNKKANPGVSFMGYFGCVGRRIETTGIKDQGWQNRTVGWCTWYRWQCHTQNSNLYCIDQFHRFPKKTATTVQLPTLL